MLLRRISPNTYANTFHGLGYKELFDIITQGDTEWLSRRYVGKESPDSMKCVGWHRKMLNRKAGWSDDRKGSDTDGDIPSSESHRDEASTTVPDQPRLCRGGETLAIPPAATDDQLVMTIAHSGRVEDCGH